MSSDRAVEILSCVPWGDMEGHTRNVRFFLERLLFATREDRYRWAPSTTEEFLSSEPWEISPYIPDEEIDRLDDRRRVIYLTGVIYDLTLTLGYYPLGKMGDAKDVSTPMGLIRALDENQLGLERSR
jgi:hypothetical protein